MLDLISEHETIRTHAVAGMQLGPSGRPMFMPQRFQLTQRGEMPQGASWRVGKVSDLLRNVA